MSAAADKNDDMVQKAMFQLTCRQGYFSKRERKSREKCKLLHHNKCYLKLGPFKLEILRA